MNAERSYLDHNASAPLRPEAVEAVAAALALTGNPSSIHAEGRAARALIEGARDHVACLVGAEPKCVIFTSGGTEANNLALSPTLRRTGDAPVSLLLAGATEHPSVLQGHGFPEMETIPVDRHGLIDLGWLESRLVRASAEGRRALVSLQFANSETGVLQSVAEAASLVHAHHGLIHTDAVQGAGRLSVAMGDLGVDALSLSAHKLGGPKGVGALVLGSDRIGIGERLVRGGGQERGFRGGTENLPGIAGFGAAAAAAHMALEAEAGRIASLRDACEATLRLLAPEAVIFGADAPRLPNTFSFAVPGLKAETALIAFDLAGVAVSSGSACSSGKVGRSHVLAAMGVDANLAEGAIRVSLGWNSADADVIRFGAACEKALAALYKRKAVAA